MKRKSTKSEITNEIKEVLLRYLDQNVKDEPSIETQREQQLLRLQTLKNEELVQNMEERILCRQIVCWFTGIWFGLVVLAYVFHGIDLLDFSDSNIKYLAGISTGVLGVFGYVIRYLFKA